MRTVIPANSTIAMSQPPGRNAVKVQGQNADGRPNHTRNEIGPFHGDMSPLPDGVSARSNAVSQMIPTAT
jgi:hypothetical protein